jgi:hypothetical protein
MNVTAWFTTGEFGDTVNSADGTVWAESNGMNITWQMSAISVVIGENNNFFPNMAASFTLSIYGYLL